MKKIKPKALADDLPYFKTSKTDPDGWIEKAKAEIVKIGGKVTGEAFASNGDEAGFLLLFTLEKDEYKVYFPVLETRSAKDLLAAKRQAATMLYHDIKARCMLVKVFGARRRFSDFLMLPEMGVTVGDMAEDNIMELPRLLTSNAPLELIKGDIVNE